MKTNDPAFASPYFEIDPETWAILRATSWAYEVQTCEDWPQAYWVAYSLWVQGYDIPGASDYQGIGRIQDLRSDKPFTVTWPAINEINKR